MPVRTNEQLAEVFARNVAAQTDAIRLGDSKAGNRFASRYIRAFNELRERGDDGRAALVPMLQHQRDDVRVMSAAFLLRHETDAAIAILEEISSGSGFAAFTASETLSRWKEGTWALDQPEPPI